MLSEPCALSWLQGCLRWRRRVGRPSPRCPQPTARFDPAAATGADGRIYAIGGTNGARLTTVEAYIAATNSWSTDASMPTARNGPQAMADTLPAVGKYGSERSGAIDHNGAIVSSTDRPMPRRPVPYRNTLAMSLGATPPQSTSLSSLVWSTLIRGSAMAAATVLLASDASLVAVYSFAVLATAAFIVYRPAHSALLPALCSSPLELTSANLVRGLLDSIGTLIGPLAAALILAFATAAAAFAFATALSLFAGVLLLRLSYEAPQRARPPGLRQIVADTAAGFRALVRYRDAGLVTGLALSQTFTRGCLNVFLVVVPLQLLKTGEPGVGLMTAAVGAGGVMGSLGAFMVVSGKRLAVIEGIGVALWGLSVSLCGAFPYLATVLGLACAIGVGNALVDVGLFTLPARLVPDDVLARVFGAFESLVAVTVALGALITPSAIQLLGVRGALAVLGVVAPILVAFAWHRLRAIDNSIVHRDAEVAVLRKVGLFQPLPLPAIDNLATHVRASRIAAGAEVFRQGDPGDRFYVIEHGEAEVVGDGRLVRRLVPGDCFGEIALLRDVPRTATVRARTPLLLFTLGRSEFMLAVGGSSASGREVDALMRERLANFTPHETD